MKTNRHGDYERLIRLPVFSNYQVRIVYSDDLAKSYTARFKRPLPRDIDTTGAFHVYSKTGCSHLFFRIGYAPSGTIAHEVCHAVFALLFEWAGVEKLDDEILAYHIGYLTGECVDFRNALIEAGVGVKSIESEVQTNGIQDSQESVGGMRRLQPGQKEGPGKARTS